MLVLLIPISAISGVAVIGGLTQKIQAERGNIYEGTIDLMNMGDKSEEVKIYQTDYTYTSDGKKIL